MNWTDSYQCIGNVELIYAIKCNDSLKRLIERCSFHRVSFIVHHCKMFIALCWDVVLSVEMSLCNIYLLCCIYYLKAFMQHLLFQHHSYFQCVFVDWTWNWRNPFFIFHIFRTDCCRFNVENIRRLTAPCIDLLRCCRLWSFLCHSSRPSCGIYIHFLFSCIV